MVMMNLKIFALTTLIAVGLVYVALLIINKPVVYGKRERVLNIDRIMLFIGIVCVTICLTPNFF